MQRVHPVIAVTKTIRRKSACFLTTSFSGLESQLAQENDASFESDQNRLGLVFGAKLSVNGRQMRRHGALGDQQSRCDLIGWQPFARKEQDFFFTGESASYGSHSHAIDTDGSR